jgi:acyl-CoA synthetase (NDP forming)
MDLQSSKRKVAALTSPRNVVLVGASDRPGNWARRIWNNLTHYGFPGPIYLINPRRQELWGQPCYSSFKALPEPPDHLLVVVPAAHVPEILYAGAAAGARTATIFSSGFGEGHDPAGIELGRRLREAIQTTGMGVSGPNCMGNLSASSKLVTLVEDRPHVLDPGPVALVGQSGGVMIFVNHAFEERGIGVSYLITSGNQIGLAIPNYIAFFSDQPQIKVIVSYLESISDLDQFRAACSMARDNGKTVVVVKLGNSEAGRNAALAHTASLAGSNEAFDAMAAELGVIRAESLDDAVEMAEFLVHSRVPGSSRIGAITLSGAFRGLLLDAADGAGVSFPSLSDETEAKLRSLLSVGSLVGNPLDGGFGVLRSADTFEACLAAMQADPNIDLIILQNELPRTAGIDWQEKFIRMVERCAVTSAVKPMAFVSVVSHGQTDYSRSIRSTARHVPFLQEVNKALRVIGASVRSANAGRLRSGGVTAELRSLVVATRMRTLASEGVVSLNEMESKNLFKEYGIKTPAELLVGSAEAAVQAASDIGYPVALKAVSRSLLHKSDVGGVILDLRSSDEVRLAYGTIHENLERCDEMDRLDGILVSQQVNNGVEVALGIHRDPEIGLVVMVGSGGIWLELMKDAAFALPPINRDVARTMLQRTRISRVLAGYRGGHVYNVDAVTDALVALGAIALDLSEAIESIDINPFKVGRHGGLALDGLVILRRP